MAKSTRSKVKRSFRAKKRTESVYAAAEAARLHRLSQKLKVITTSKTAEDDESPEEEAGAAERDQSGWCWFAHFGLYDPADITAERMQAMVQPARRNMSVRLSGNSVLERRTRESWVDGESSSSGQEEDGSALFNHLFLSPPHSEVGSGK